VREWGAGVGDSRAGWKWRPTHFTLGEVYDVSADRVLPPWAQRLIELRRARAWSAADLAWELKKLRDGLPSVRSLTHMIQLDWEAGKHRPGPRYRLLLATVHETNEHEIFGDLAKPTAMAQPVHEPVGSPVKATEPLTLAWGSTSAEAAGLVTELWKTDIERREIIASVWAVDALSEPLGRWLLESADRDLTSAGSRQIGRADVDAVWSMCSAFADADHRLGGGYARRTLVSYADDAAAPLLAGRYTDQTGRELFAAVARLCDIAGFMCFDSDYQGLGQKYFIMALRLAKASDDQALGAHILTDMSMQAQLERHANEAVVLADASVAAATKSGSASTLARCQAVRARALALRGDVSDSDHALNQAERALDRSAPRNEPFWITFFTAQQLAAEALYAAAELNRVSLMRRHAANVMSAVDGVMQRRHVLATATLATSYLPAEDTRSADGADVGKACEVLRGVLPVIGSLTSVRALRMVSAVRGRLGEYSQLDEVRELERDLHECLTAGS
jgi:hypothetical protein